MNRFLWLILMVTCLASPLRSSARADDPSDGTPGAAFGRTATPADRVSVRIKTGETRYDWKWLATRQDQDGDGTVIREEFPASADVFEQLDRNWDGKLTPDDFDWSETGTLGWQKETTFALFKAVDTTSEGRITPEEWQALFAKAAEEKGYLTDAELEGLIFRPRVLKAQREQQSQAGRLERVMENFKPIVEAPKPGDIAPDFELHSPNGLTTVRLSSFRGDKPVVLIFGSFT